MSDLGPRRRAARAARRRKRLVSFGLVSLIVALITAIAVWSLFTFLPAVPVAEPTPEPIPTQTATPTPTPTPTPTFDTTALSIDDPSSLWVVVNKLRQITPEDYQAPDLVDVPVPHTYAPRLRAEASDAVVAMFAAFQAETGLQMQSLSAYRPFSVQTKVYNGLVGKLGQAGADSTSARPGHSEHQTGLAIDIGGLPAKCALAACFADTPQGQWLAANAWKWGFMLRYPADKTPITGYAFEPWHYRYVGVELATELHDTGVTTLEEFFGLPPAPDYAG